MTALEPFHECHIHACPGCGSEYTEYVTGIALECTDCGAVFDETGELQAVI